MNANDGWARRTRRGAVALAAGLMLATAAGGGSAQVPASRQASEDPLDRAALVSPRALHALILTVARAERRLVAAGERGIVLVSDDDGKAWRQANVPVSVTLTSLSFPTAQQGWAVGHSGVVLHSEDGGLNWVKQLDGKMAAKLELDAARQAGDKAGTQRLADAERLVADGPDKPFLAVHFLDPKHGLVVGAYGLALATDDGGMSWYSIRDRIDNPKGKHLYAIHTDGGEVLISGEQGALYRSTDGGATFKEVKTPYAGSYFGVLRGKAGQTVVFGLRGNAYASGDMGQHWRQIDTGLPVTLTAGLRLADNTLVLVDESGRVLRSTDDGQTFPSVPSARPMPFTSLVQAADGALILGSVAGPKRVELNAVSAEKKL